MRLKHYIWSLMAMLAMVTGIQQPLLAENKPQQKKHKSHSSSSSNKDDKCCKKTNKLLKQINETTQQDLVVDQTTLNVVNQINQTTRTDLAIDQETLEIVKHLEDCSCTCTVILPEDFEDSEGNLTVTYVITEPGSYCLGADVAFAPADEFTPAINILASDVRLDLRGFTLSQANDTPNAYGVQIGQGYFYSDPDAVLKNITVLNGSIIDCTAIGIFCYNGSFDEPTAELAFEDLHFFDLNILDCGSNPSFDFGSGINLDSVAGETLYDLDLPVAYKNVIIKNTNVNHCFGNSAINIFTCDNLIIENTNANNFLNEISGFEFISAYFIETRNLQMLNCQANGTTALDPIGEVSGAFMFGSINVYIKDSQFNDTFGENCNIVQGAHFTNNQNAIYENCQFNNARGGEFTNVVNGIHMSDFTLQETQANGIKFINCQFNGASRVANGSGEIPELSICAGITMLTIRNVEFENCQACNITTDNPTFNVYGFLLATHPTDPIPFFANSRNLSLNNCVASDLHSPNGAAIGFFFNGRSLHRTGEQASLFNTILNHCIAERISSESSTAQVAGMAEGLFTVASDINEGPFPAQFNLFIKDCRISDVRAGEENPLSAGILVQSVKRPVLCGNSVSDCDRGILFTGTNEIIPNCFQLAATLDDALASPPIFIPLSVQLQVQTDQIGLGPFPAVLAEYSPAVTAPVSGLGAVAVDGTPPVDDACQTLTNNLAGKIGVARRGVCGFTVKTTNIEAAGGIGTIIVNTTGAPFIMGGAPTGTGPSVMISTADGNALIAALNSNPNITVTIDTSPSAASLYTFMNSTQGNSVNAVAGDVNNQLDFICPSDDLTALGWQPGDTIFFDCNGGPTIPELECDTNYYAIVYIPGFSRNGLIQNNKVDNCSISCYQDDTPLPSTTSSAWVNNTAFNCGSPPSGPCPDTATNYDINFAGVRPVDCGTLSNYPVGGNKYYNLSLVP